MNERRLNPLAFASETNGRFTILIVLAIVLIWLVGFSFLMIIALLLGYNSPLVNALQPIDTAIGSMEESDGYFQDLSSEELATYY